MTAQSGLEALKARYDAAGSGKDVLAVLDFGTNPGLELPADKPIHVWSRAGMVTAVLGNNVWAGGDNDVAFGLAPYLPIGTVEVDGKIVIQDGKLAGTEPTPPNGDACIDELKRFRGMPSQGGVRCGGSAQ